MEIDLVKESMIKLEAYLREPISESKMKQQDFERLMKGAAPGVTVKTEVNLPVKLKKSNRGNVRTEVDGINFHSKKEAEHYKKLKLLLKVGEITDLKMQQKWELNPKGNYSFCYISDFEFIRDGVKVVQDVKPFDEKTGKYLLTALFKKKAKLMLKLYGIKIEIV